MSWYTLILLDELFGSIFDVFRLTGDLLKVGVNLGDLSASGVLTVVDCLRSSSFYYFSRVSFFFKN
jgi:hypothetical protein